MLDGYAAMSIMLQICQVELQLEAAGAKQKSKQSFYKQLLETRFLDKSLNFLVQGPVQVKFRPVPGGRSYCLSALLSACLCYRHWCVDWPVPLQAAAVDPVLAYLNCLIHCSIKYTIAQHQVPGLAACLHCCRPAFARLVYATLLQAAAGNAVLGRSLNYLIQDLLQVQCSPMVYRVTSHA